MRYLLFIPLFALTSLASAQPAYEITSSEWPASTYLAHRDIVEYADIGGFFGQHLPTAYQAIASAGLIPGAATGLYWSFDEETGLFDVAAGVPFSGVSPETIPDGFAIVNVAEATGLSLDYYGPYESLRAAHEAIDAHRLAAEMEPAFLVVEEYVSGPATEPDSSKWLTRIHYLFER